MDEIRPLCENTSIIKYIHIIDKLYPETEEIIKLITQFFALRGI